MHFFFQFALSLNALVYLILYVETIYETIITIKIFIARLTIVLTK
jgi:hypothetical protein